MFSKVTVISTVVLLVLFAGCLKPYDYTGQKAQDDDVGADDDDTSDDDDAADDDDASTTTTVTTTTSTTTTTIAGTWTDSTSGLMWQVEPTGGTMSWSSAKSHCQGLSLGDFGDWHLPTISELRSLIRGCDFTETDGPCGVTDECLSSSCRNGWCYGCSDGGGPAGGCYWPSQMQGACGGYWSSSAVDDLGGFAWVVAFNSGYLDYTAVADAGPARCVRP